MATNVFKGSCSCGAIKIEVHGDPAFASLCHCYNCQKSTGSSYSSNWVISRSQFTIVTGEPTTYEVKGESGGKSKRQFCGTCSSTMWTESEKFPDLIVVKAGVMDDGAQAKFPPRSESFTSRKPGWVKEVDDAIQFEGAYQTKTKE